MALPVGTQAPDFTLRTSSPDGLIDVKLSENLGKTNTVLLFFPAAFTGVCTEELCGVSNGLGDFEAANAVVYGISADSPFAQKAWAEAQSIKVALLSDYNREVIEAYDVELPDFAGTGGTASQRAVFIVGQDGKIAYVQVTDSPGDLPDMAALKAALSALG